MRKSESVFVCLRVCERLCLGAHEREREIESERERVCERWVTVKEVREEILLLPELVFI